MVSSLGLDVVSACAAARAGISRAQELDFPIQHPEDKTIENVTGYALPMITQGFEGDIRLVRLLQGALKDLMRQVADRPWREARAGFYLSIPDPMRLYTGLHRIVDDQYRQQKQKEAKEAAQESLPANTHASLLLNKATGLCEWENKVLLKKATNYGHTGVIESIGYAIQDLQRGEVDLAIVGGVDSLVETNTLQWLSELERLKTPGTPMGLQPGEAGGFIILEKASRARSRGAGPLGVIQGMSFQQGCESMLSNHPQDGAGLARAIAELITKSGWKPEAPCWMITDQNGENCRAMEWGYAQVKLRQRWKVFGDVELWYPVSSFGDIGAATAAVSICLALSAFAGGYAPSKTVAILASAESTMRAGLLLSTPNR